MRDGLLFASVEINTVEKKESRLEKSVEQRRLVKDKDLQMEFFASTGVDLSLRRRNQGLQEKWR